ncbi:hypothetical protein GCM10012275_61250 [Longimycelium tulufanense]|uniref:DUF3558 domain-containing protein n=1 Tax=Longimycelium tulufanense TaxID=907463 RepID=A0A8J3CEG2_9PSEU|nr:DUF3558 domain-containing protein [Longimycelium tulufanense]GGM82411.1 hypothetical protein GCM10012275_61250 [Longimycelium tulufanense]
MLRRLLVLPPVCVAALALASCGGGEQGSPAATDKPTSVATSNAPTTRVAPPLTAPALDTTSFEKNPCTLLRDDQLTQFGPRKPSTSQNGLTGPGCVWRPEDPTVGTRVAVDINTKSGGLEGIYQRRDKYGYFQETEVGGYPGVHAIDWRDAPSHGNCTSLIGVSKDRLIVTYVTIPRKTDPDYETACGASDRVAGMVIENLKGAR